MFFFVTVKTIFFGNRRQNFKGHLIIRSNFAGNHSVTAIICKIRSRITRESSGRIDYVECVDAGTVMPLKKIQGKTMIALAVWFGKTRLIDNIIVHA